MSTVQTWQTVSTSSDATQALGEAVGRRLKGGEVIELVGDLGGGKTTFVRGMARGMGSADRVSSPSFTLTNEYHSGHKTLYHLDFYRLSEAGVMRDELAEFLKNDQAVVVIEWAGVVEDVLPAERLKVRLQPSGETERRLSFEYPRQLQHLIPINT